MVWPYWMNGRKNTRNCGGHHKENALKKDLALCHAHCESSRFGRLKNGRTDCCQNRRWQINGRIKPTKKACFHCCDYHIPYWVNYRSKVLSTKWYKELLVHFMMCFQTHLKWYSVDFAHTVCFSGYSIP